MDPMSNQVPFANGAPAPQTPDMSPSERKLWANSHALDARYLLVTSAEMKLMMEGMAQMRELAGALRRTHKELELNLADYWKNEPDLPNGVAAAVFDAKKYKDAVTRAIPTLRKLHEVFFAAATKVAGFNPAFGNELGTFANNLGQQVKELEKAHAQRRDRRSTKG